MLIVVLATTEAHEDEPRMFHNLTFTNTDLHRNHKKNQLEDILSFNLYDGETRINKKKAISLYMLDPEDEYGNPNPEWVPASFRFSRKQDAEGRLEIRKPLVGYELEPESDCKKRGLRKVPYERRRWGENTCMRDKMDGKCGYFEISFDIFITFALVAGCSLQTLLPFYNSVNFSIL